MLSCRYAIRIMDLDSVNTFNALKVSNESGKEEKSVCFSKDAVSCMPIVTKMNSLLFQAMEELKWEESGEKPQSCRPINPSHGISDAFLNDLMIIKWPQEKDNHAYMDPNSLLCVTGKELRKHMFKHGFKIGEGEEKIEMVPLLAGAGMAREGKYLFIRKAFQEKVLQRITLSLLRVEDGKLKLNMVDTIEDGKKNNTINMAKLCAYIGLADTGGQSLSELSSIWNKAANPDSDPAKGMLFTEDSIVVVPDVKGPLGITSLGDYTVENVNKGSSDTVENVDKGSSDSDKDNPNPLRVRIRELDPSTDTANYTDGYGFICPDWSERLNRLMLCRKTGRTQLGEQDFHHRAFIVRMPFVKGALTECDFRQFLEAHHVTEIKDIWGNTHRVEDVKVILTRSMFKGDPFYNSMKEKDAPELNETVWGRYIRAFNKSGMSMVIAGSDSAPTKRTSLNYQFLSSMQPDEGSLEKLIQHDIKAQENRFELLKGPGKGKDIKEYAERVADCLHGDARRTEPPKAIEIPQGDSEELLQLDSDEERIEESHETGGDYSALLARIVRRYPEAAYTKPVMEELAESAVRAALDVCQGRVTVAGDTRMLIGDPFALLGSLAGIQNFHLLQSNGWVYAPGMEEQNELLLLRNPHVSIFEAIVAKNLDISRGKDGTRQLYGDYFGNHTGCLFVNSAVAATLSGADYDGDRCKAVFEASAIQLVKHNIEKIYELLKKSPDHDFRVSTQNMTGKALPIVNIVPFSANNTSVAEVNSGFWDYAFATYEKSMSSRVGKFSLETAQIAFNCGMVAQANCNNEKQRNAAIEFLKTMAYMSTVIGLEIDAAKSGVPPTPGRRYKKGARPPILSFSRYVQEHGSATFKGLELFKSAAQFALWTPEDFGEKKPKGKETKAPEESTVDFSSLKGTPAAKALIERFSKEILPDEQNQGSDLNALLNKKKAISFSRALYQHLEEDPSFDENILDVVKEKLNGNREARSETKKREVSIHNISTQYANISEYLRARYPVTIAYKLEAAIQKDPKAAGDGLKLENDKDLLKLAFGKNSERREALKAVIFGDDADAEAEKSFVYDETAIQLAKAIKRWRGAHAKFGKNDAGGVPVLYGQLKAEIEKIAQSKALDYWQLGLRLLEANKIPVRMFVILFGDKCPAPTSGKEAVSDAESGERRAECHPVCQ